MIQSSIQTFGRWHPRNKGFAEIARERRYATETILSCEPGGGQAYSHAKVVRYEALVENTEAIVYDTLLHARLDPEVYDFGALHQLPVRGSSALASPVNQRWAPHDKTGRLPAGRPLAPGLVEP